ncbi:iron ABC transporter permease [Nocardia sp. CNY236]|uniref:FecCD family ABC transporter permease n=1 Tax=Nocardia sp. CNY236 TaxID=1169152 RepID=UPI00040ABE7D|nr:iron ABC transporter permease [Nocardia sp. CNY236]
MSPTLRRSDPPPTRWARSGRLTPTGILTVGALTVALACLAAIALGSVPVALSEVWATIRFHALHLGPEPDPLSAMIVWQLRLPRVLAAMVVGAALSVAGAVLQGMVRNPLADPFVLGVSSGAALAAVAVMSSASALWIRNLGVPVAGFVGASAALLLVLLFAHHNGQFTGPRIVLAGVAVGQVAAAATSLIQLRSEPAEIRGILFWMMGSVADARPGALALPAALAVACLGWLLMQGRGLNALSMGDDDAVALGIDVHRLRLKLIVIVAVLTGLSVSIAGGVGFVGLIIPHLARFAAGADYRRLLPAAAVFGAAFLIVIDLAARAIDTPNEYPLTIFTAALGGPFFLWLLKRSRSGGAV